MKNALQWRRRMLKGHSLRVCGTGLCAFAIGVAVTSFLGLLSERGETALRTLPEELQGSCGKVLASRWKRPVYVFLHLHKTAGNNLKVALFGFAKKNSLSMFHTCSPTLGESKFSAWWFNRKKVIGLDYDCNLDRLAAMPPSDRDAYEFIVGHQYFGVHSLLPRRDARYLTFLRHPLARKVSHFAHFETPSALGNATARTDPRLIRYLLEDNRMYMVKRLASASYASEYAADVRNRFIDVEVFASRAALRAAQRNLVNHFFFVGLQERYAESMCVLAHILNIACYGDGWPVSVKKFDSRKVVNSHENARYSTQALIDELPEHIRNAVAQSEHFDLLLYRFAEALFERKLRHYPQCRLAPTTAR